MITDLFKMSRGRSVNDTATFAASSFKFFNLASRNILDVHDQHRAEFEQTPLTPSGTDRLVQLENDRAIHGQHRGFNENVAYAATPARGMLAHLAGDNAVCGRGGTLDAMKAIDFDPSRGDESYLTARYFSLTSGHHD